MVRRKDERSTDSKQMFGGEGRVRMCRILENADEMYGKGRIFNHIYLEKGCEVGWHIHQEKPTTFSGAGASIMTTAASWSCFPGTWLLWTPGRATA